jgi:hypothetical protein
MSIAALRPDASGTSVEALHQRISGLANERQVLRDEGAAHERLEQNRRELVDAQWALSHALIERYLAPQHGSHAA